MKTKVLFCGVLVATAALTGCVTKARSFDAEGMYVSESGQIAVGKIHVDAIPEGTDSAVVHYTEDTALLSPSTKTHDIDIILTGTNSVGSAQGIVKAICNAFVKVAPSAPTAYKVADCPDGSCDDPDGPAPAPCPDGSCDDPAPKSLTQSSPSALSSGDGETSRPSRTSRETKPER